MSWIVYKNALPMCQSAVVRHIMWKSQPPTKHHPRGRPQLTCAQDPPSSDDDASGHSCARKVGPRIVQRREGQLVLVVTERQHLSQDEIVYVPLLMPLRTAKRPSLSTRALAWDLPQPVRPTPMSSSFAERFFYLFF